MQQLLIVLFVSAALFGSPVDGCSSQLSCNGHGTVTGGTDNVNCTCHCQEGWTENPTCLYYAGPCYEYSFSSCISQAPCVWFENVCQHRAIEHCQSIKTQEVCDEEETNTCEWSQEWQNCNRLPNAKTHMPHSKKPVGPVGPGPYRPTLSSAPTEAPLQVPSSGTLLRTVGYGLGSLMVLVCIGLGIKKWNRRGQSEARDLANHLTHDLELEESPRGHPHDHHNHHHNHHGHHEKAGHHKHHEHQGDHDESRHHDSCASVTSPPLSHGPVIVQKARELSPREHMYKYGRYEGDDDDDDSRASATSKPSFHGHPEHGHQESHHHESTPPQRHSTGAPQEAPPDEEDQEFLEFL